MNGQAQSHHFHSDIAKRQFHAGQTIFKEGEPGDVVHLLRQGMVEIRHAQNGGKPRQLAILHPGDIFGEMALFDDRRRMASAVALTDCETIIVSKDEFQRRIHQTDPAIRHLVMLLIHRLREADQLLACSSNVERTHWSEADRKVPA